MLVSATAKNARRDPDVRQALKFQQLARLKAKADPNITAEQYSAMYAAQPEQVARAAENEANRATRRAVKSGAVVSAVAAAQGAAQVFEAAATQEDAE